MTSSGTSRSAATPSPLEPVREVLFEEIGRSAKKRQAIIRAATALFLRDGYRGTSMDQVAAAAAVSKQTVYKHFEDKEQLFRDIVLEVTANAEVIIADLTAVLRETTVDSIADLERRADGTRASVPGWRPPAPRAGTQASCYCRGGKVSRPAKTYFEQAPARGIEVIARVA